jgi:phosphohistidine phosphatase
MPTLVLLRHAKSAWGDERLADHDRPLAPRGERAAELLGVYLAQRAFAPDLVLCSTAARTRQTLDRVLAKLRSGAAAGKADSHAPADPEVRHERRLYLASAEELLERLREIPERAQRVLLVGHNPGLEDLAGSLAGTSGREELRGGLPTAACAELEVQGPWRALDRGGARLVSFRRPKDLV